MSTIKKNKRIIAYFLPQFHECEYNNSWWGKGFTEWDIVKQAKPLYKNHYQPKKPYKYFRLDDSEEIQNQFNTAQKYGIDGFAIYNYWYNGERLLKKPLDIILKNKDLNINYSICWANHSWTRSWKNRTGSLDVLIEQVYELPGIHRERHFDFLCQIFIDKRYIRIDDNPLFQIYNPTNIPELESFISDFREYAFKRYNLKIHFCAVISSWQSDYSYLKNFDSSTFFQPGVALWSPENVFSKLTEQPISVKSIRNIVRDLPLPVKKVLYLFQDSLYNRPQFFDYDETWSKIIKQTILAENNGHIVYPGAFVDFDNTARYKKRAKIFKGFAPDKFGTYLKTLLENTAQDIVFLNAWNEWGEGMYLQADEIFGNQRLEELYKAIVANE